jgi:integrase/recombinase XerD
MDRRPKMDVTATIVHASTVAHAVRTRRESEPNPGPSLRNARRRRHDDPARAFAGLRVHEIVKIRDVDPTARTLRVTGKGNVTAVLPLHPLLVEAAQGMPRRGWWFPGNSHWPGQPIRSRGVADIIGQAMDRAGTPGGTVHRLRHWYGTELVADGADLRTAQTLLRHANLNTTAIYTQVVDSKRVEAIDRLTLPE